MSTPYLSAVICTLDRYPDVEVCLTALLASKTASSIDCEIIIIDQTDPPKRVENLISRFPGVRHIHQNEKGLSTARNLAFKAARGEIIAYLDDDAIPSLPWVDEICAPFMEDRDGQILAVGGKVVADYRKGARPPWMTSQLEAFLSCVDWGDTGRKLKAGEWIVGANMAFRRSVFDEHDLFDVSLGRKGSRTLLSNEEVALIHKIGVERIWYNPAASVGHVIGPERMEQKWFRKRIYWQAVSDLIADTVWITPEMCWSDISGFLTASPAELRSVLGFFHESDDPALFDRQMKAIYGLVMMGADGFLLPDQAAVSGS